MTNLKLEMRKICIEMCSGLFLFRINAAILFTEGFDSLLFFGGEKGLIKVVCTFV